MTYVEPTERDEAVRATVAAAMVTREQCVYGPRGEIKALADVQARLEKRFPELHPDVVAAAVRLAQSELDGPVRDFVPVLVEHAARDRLAFAEPAPSATLPPEAENAEAIEPVGH